MLSRLRVGMPSRLRQGMPSRLRLQRLPNRLRLVMLVAVGALLWLGMFLITDSLCWFQATIGLPCPGCGSSRAASALLRGDFVEAMRWHPLILLTLALLPAAAIRFAMRSASARRRAAGAGKPAGGATSADAGGAARAGAGGAARVEVWKRRALISAVALYCAVYAARMAMLFPHTQPMAPHDAALLRQAARLLQSLFIK